MKLLPRKVTFQLTPLLDLLLIVIFAQYLEMRNSSADAQEQAAKEATRNQSELRAATASNASLQRDLEAARKLAADRNRAIADLNRKLNTDEGRQKLLEDQRNLLARQMAKLFDMPEKELAKVLKPLFTRDGPRRKQQIKKIEARIAKLRKSDPHRILRHVVKHQELLKRADIWEIHIARDNTATVSIDGKSSKVTYSATPIKTTGDKEKDDAEYRRYFRELKADFVRKMVAYYKSLPQTKNVIIVLLSEGKGVTGFTYRAARDGMADVGLRIATEAGGRVQIVTAELGEVPLQPTSN